MTELLITESDRGRSLEIPEGALVSVRLDENPTTGYAWSFSTTEAGIVTLEESEFEIPEGPEVGRGGQRIFRLRARSQGRTRLDFRHWRDWEGESSVIARFEVTVLVGS